MSLIEKIRAKAKDNMKRIALPEGDESRTVAAAKIVAEEGIADPVLITPASISDPANASRLSAYARALYELRKAKGLTEEAAERLASLSEE